MNRMYEKIELIKITGLLDSLYHDALSIEEVINLYFLPKTAIRLKKENCNELIISLIWECCELEDIESIIPQKLKQKILELKQKSIELLKTYEDIEGIEWE